MAINEKPLLISLAVWQNMSPWDQGYISYIQGNLPGSELLYHQDNPYPAGTQPYDLFNDGSRAAVIAVMDCEDS